MSLKLQDNNCSLLQKTRAREVESLREENLGSGAWLIYLPGFLYKRRLGPICHNCIQETSEPHLHQAVTAIQHYNEFLMQDRLLADGFHSDVPGGARSSFHRPARELNLTEQPLDLVAREAQLSAWCFNYWNNLLCMIKFLSIKQVITLSRNNVLCCMVLERTVAMYFCVRCIIILLFKQLNACAMNKKQNMSMLFCTHATRFQSRRWKLLMSKR